MPTERRRLIFSNDEIVAALLTYCRATGIALPDADVDGIDIDLGMGCTCTIGLTFAVDSPSEIDELELDCDTVMAALVNYCRIQSIPLPRATEKRLESADGCLSMVFDMRRAGGSVRCVEAA